MTVESFYDYSEEDFKKMNEYFRNHPEITVIQMERKIDETWKDWIRLSDKIKLTNYVLREIKLKHSSKKESLLVFINIKNTALTLEKYYNDFEKAVGYHFDPLKVVLELERGKQDFWEIIVCDKKLLGILLGYGYENACLCSWYSQDHNHPFLINLYEHSYPSENNEPRITSHFFIDHTPFRLPIFACLEPKAINLLRNILRIEMKLLNFIKIKTF
jgi:hypothetical protein